MLRCAPLCFLQCNHCEQIWVGSTSHALPIMFIRLRNSSWHIILHIVFWPFPRLIIYVQTMSLRKIECAQAYPIPAVYQHSSGLLEVAPFNGSDVSQYVRPKCQNNCSEHFYSYSLNLMVIDWVVPGGCLGVLVGHNVIFAFWRLWFYMQIQPSILFWICGRPKSNCKVLPGFKNGAYKLYKLSLSVRHQANPLLHWLLLLRHSLSIGPKWDKHLRITTCAAFDAKSWGSRHLMPFPLYCISQNQSPRLGKI